jgi:beta-1,4-N-acetylglucosaminyltransferase
MKILVTVGTGQFNSLVNLFDTYCNHDFTIQHGGGQAPKIQLGYPFIPNLVNEFDKYDLIITHAGAGTIFNLLKTKKAFCVFPNQERHDLHQLELAKYVDENKFAPVYYESDIEYDIISMFRKAKFCAENRNYQGGSFNLPKLMELLNFNDK